MKIFSSFLVLAVISTCFVNCGKDSNPDPTPASANMTNITASAWTYETVGLDGDRNGTIDLPVPPGTVPTCLSDNKLTFKSDNTAIADEGATKCNSSDPQTSTFNWNFADNESNLNISTPVFGVFSGKLKIISLTNTSFVLAKDTVLSSQPMYLIVKLKH